MILHLVVQRMQTMSLCGLNTDSISWTSAPDVFFGRSYSHANSKCERCATLYARAQARSGVVLP